MAEVLEQETPTKVPPSNQPKKEKWGDLSWSEKKNRIDGTVDSIGKVLNVLKGLKTEDNGNGGVSPVQVGNYGAAAVSDERLKNKEKIASLFGGDGATEAFSKIDAYVYNYTPKAQNDYQGEHGVDNTTHFGPIAQDLAENPVTSGTVHKDENGYLMVDTRQLALTNTAMISQLARKVEELEEIIRGK